MGLGYFPRFSFKILTVSRPYWWGVKISKNIKGVTRISGYLYNNVKLTFFISNLNKTSLLSDIKLITLTFTNGGNVTLNADWPI
jgi:hypothetical protein